MIRNKVILIGRLTKDADIRTTQAGKTVARYTLAVDGFGADAEASFISCVAFGKSAEFVEKYLVKGSKVAIEGHIQTGHYDKADGTRVYTTDVIVETHEFVESKRANAPDVATMTNEFETPLESELPFV